MKRRLNSITAQSHKFSGFVNAKPSVTVPNQVLSLREVVERYRRGQSVQMFSGGYDPLIPPGLENMDKIERIEALRAQRAHVAKIRSELSKPKPEPTAKSDSKPTPEATEE